MKRIIGLLVILCHLKRETVCTLKIIFCTGKPKKNLAKIAKCAGGSGRSCKFGDERESKEEQVNYTFFFPFLYLFHATEIRLFAPYFSRVIVNHCGFRPSTSSSLITQLPSVHRPSILS